MLVVQFAAEHIGAYQLPLRGKLRSEGIGVEVYPEAKKVGQQLKYAESRASASLSSPVPMNSPRVCGKSRTWRRASRSTYRPPKSRRRCERSSELNHGLHG